MKVFNKRKHPLAIFSVHTLKIFTGISPLMVIGLSRLLKERNGEGEGGVGVGGLGNNSSNNNNNKPTKVWRNDNRS